MHAWISRLQKHVKPCNATDLGDRIKTCIPTEAEEPWKQKFQAVSFERVIDQVERV